ncbi:MAG: hypothetical protein GW893_09785 [Armatimonadetes bacterium]|nr:hypothetical protein [Armatimonadota bacterium]
MSSITPTERPPNCPGRTISADLQSPTLRMPWRKGEYVVSWLDGRRPAIFINEGVNVELVRDDTPGSWIVDPAKEKNDGRLTIHLSVESLPSPPAPLPKCERGETLPTSCETPFSHLGLTITHILWASEKRTHLILQNQVPDTGGYRAAALRDPTHLTFQRQVPDTSGYCGHSRMCQEPDFEKSGVQKNPAKGVFRSQSCQVTTQVSRSS